jgi:hypothetical protein
MLTKVSAGVLNIDDLYGFRNRIINGDMRIAQRGTAAVTASNYVVDRWAFFENGSMVFSVQQSTTAPAGYVNSLAVTVSTSASPSAATRSQLYQSIEGLNVSDLAWGTASAKTVTLSFWVRSSLTGQFGGSLQNSAKNRSYPFSYTISAANTWEQKSITIAGDTSGTWLTTNGIGVDLMIDLGAGSDLLGTAGAWAGADYRGATGDVKLNETSGATFYITGVQLEVGSVATPFERRPFGTELALCQRYFQKITAAPGVGQNGSTTIVDLNFTFRVDMRATPTASPAGALQVTDTAADFTQSSASISSFFGNVSGARAYLPNFTGLTALRPCFLRTDSPSIQLSAEL